MSTTQNSSAAPTLIVAWLATAMLMLDVAVVNTAIPHVAAGLHAGLGALKWVIDAYVLAMATTVLTVGSLADRFGRRAVFAGGLVVFTAASLGCAVSDSVGTLDAARAVQGVGASALFALVGAGLAAVGTAAGWRLLGSRSTTAAAHRGRPRPRFLTPTRPRDGGRPARVSQTRRAIAADSPRHHRSQNMHTTLSILNARRRRRRRRGAMVALLAGCAGLVGCGGSTPGQRSVPAGAPTAASATAVAPKPAVASAPAASGPQASSGSAIAGRCSASAGGNPATMIVCLAKHGVTVQTNGRFVSCLQSASDAAAVNACVTRDIK